MNSSDASEKRTDVGTVSGTDDETNSAMFDPMKYDFNTSTLFMQDEPEKKDVPCRFHDGFSGRCWKGASCLYGHQIYTGGRFAAENPVWSAAANSVRTVNSVLNLNPGTALKNGDQFSAVITYFKDPSEFYIRRTFSEGTQKVPGFEDDDDANNSGLSPSSSKLKLPETTFSRPQSIRHFHSVSERLNSFLRTGERYRSFRVDEYFPMTELVAVRVKSHWNRAVIRKNSEDKGTFRVLLLDTGEESVVEKKDVCRLPDHFCEKPVEALKCCLYGISPVIGYWCSEAKKTFMDLVAEREFSAILEYQTSKDGNFSLFERYPHFVKLVVGNNEGETDDIAEILANRRLGLKWKYRGDLL